MRRFNSDLSVNSNKNWKTPYLEIILVGAVQFFLSLLILCYGVLLMQFILKDLYNLKTSLWTAISYACASKITSPWIKSYCKYVNTKRRKIYKRNITVISLIWFCDLIVLSFYHTSTCIIIFYGIFGGIFSKMIHTHLSFATAEAFKQNSQLFTILDQLAKSVCLLIMPHFVLYLTNLYGTAQSFLILAGFVLNIIPACLLIRPKKKVKMRLCKFQTIDRLSFEMTDLNSKLSIGEEPSSSSSSEKDEEDEEKEEEEKEVGSEPSGSCSSVQKYYQNVGVKILPNIPEESDMEEEDDINEITSKRLSRISAILQEINENTPKDINLSTTNLFQPDQVIESSDSENDGFIDEPSPKKTKSCTCCSTLLNKYKVGKNRLKSCFSRQCLKPIPRVLRTIHFYPILISNCITTLLSTTVFATAPYLMFLKNEPKIRNYPNTPEESTFLLTIIGFTWLFFLAGYPVFNKLSSLKIKLLFLAGLSLIGLSLFIVHKFSYDNFVLFSLTFGLGQGVVSYAENIANENFCGETKWKLIQGGLEITTGVIVILIYIIIYFSSLEIHDLLSYSCWLYGLDVLLWMLAYFIKKIYVHFKSAGRYNVEKFTDFQF